MDNRTDLIGADNCQRCEVIEAANSLTEAPNQLIPKRAFGQIHLENRVDAMLPTITFQPGRHCQ